MFSYVSLTPTLKDKHYYPHVSGRVLGGSLAQDHAVPMAGLVSRWGRFLLISGVFVHRPRHCGAVVLGLASRGQSEAMGPRSGRTRLKGRLFVFSVPRVRTIRTAGGFLSPRLPRSQNMWVGGSQTLQDAAENQRCSSGCLCVEFWSQSVMPASPSVN